MKVTYYPGCSLEGTARDYADSIESVCGPMEIELQEIPDWNCCGATAAHSINHRASIDLPGRNLKLAARLGNTDMLVPCPLCFNRLKAAVARTGEGQRPWLSNPPGFQDAKDLGPGKLFRRRRHLEKLASGVKKQLYADQGCLLLRLHGEQAAGSNRGNRLRKSTKPRQDSENSWRNPYRLALQDGLLRGEPHDLPRRHGL